MKVARLVEWSFNIAISMKKTALNLVVARLGITYAVGNKFPAVWKTRRSTPLNIPMNALTMKQLITTALGLVAIAVSHTHAAVLGGPLTNAANGHVYYLLTLASWPASETQAVALGGHLVTINDAVENDWVYSTFATYGGVARPLWIGLTDQDDEGTFRWVSGEVANYRNWSDGEPNNQGGVENHCFMWGSGSAAVRASRWNDATGSTANYAYGLVEVRQIPEIVVEQPSGTDLTDGFASVDFGSRRVGDSSERTFRIRNMGLAELTGLGITMSGPHSSEFTVTTSPTAPLSGPGGTTTFTVAFSPVAVGAKMAVLHIASNDSDESPFDITLHGTGLAATTLEIHLPSSLLVKGEPGSRQIVLYASELGTAYGWQSFAELTIPSEGVEVVAIFTTDAPKRFYRAVSPAGMVYIPPGTFVMGSPASEKERRPDEIQHTVNLTKGFWMGEREVTQGEYLSVMGTNSSYFTNGVNAQTPGTGGRVTNNLRHPVENVSWIDATNYCAKLTQRDRAAGLIPADYAYRLPTESEWEYACRGGTTNAFSFGTAIRQRMANFDTRSEYESSVGTQSKPATGLIFRTVEVGSYAANAFGLYDMHGNVWEWCSDWYGTYPTGVVTDPTGPTSGSDRVYRGGAWGGSGWLCRAVWRGLGGRPAYRDFAIGFRVVLSPGK